MKILLSTQRSVLLALFCLATPVAAQHHAQDNPEQKALELNPMGGIMAGNQAGTIPAWTGGMPRSKKMAERNHLKNPFKAEQPLFHISSDNAHRYTEQLSAGQLAMLSKYPSFRLPIYTTHRTASYPEFVYQALNDNRVTAKLEHDELGNSAVLNSKIASPFPVPANGEEAIWNHSMRWRGISLVRNSSYVSVTNSGYYRPILTKEEIAFPYASPDFDLKKYPNFPQAQIAYKQKFVAPSSVAGSGRLVYEGFDYINHNRVLWVYSKRLLRVFRSPLGRTDKILPLSDGIARIDDVDMYRGTTASYNWELLGRQEMYVPYNSYLLEDHSKTHKDIIDDDHLNTDLTRYELHRVWKVKAVAKAPDKQSFDTRIFYLDEDSWQILLSEKYKGGELVTYAEAHPVNFYQVPVLYSSIEVHYLPQKGRYFVSGINNHENGNEWMDEINPRRFSPNALYDYLR